MRLASGRVFLLAAAALVFGSQAHAVVLVPGVVTPLPGTTVADEPQLAGTILVDELIPFSFVADNLGGRISGTVQQRVVQSDLDGTMDFYWRVMLDKELPDALGSFRLGDFVSPEYNANYRTDGDGTVAPSYALRFTAPFESFVNFDFRPDGLQSGRSSYFFFLDTSATAYAKTAVFDLTNIDQTLISGAFAAYAPATAPVPEPSTLALLGLGLVGLARKRRRAD